MIMKLVRLSLALLALMWIAAPVVAAVTATPVFVQTPKNWKFQLVNGSGTTAQTLITCGSDGTKVVGMWATSTDTSNRTVEVILTKGGTDYLQSSTTVPLASGTDGGGTPTAWMMHPSAWIGLPTDSDGNRFFYCETGDVVKVRAQAAVTAAKVIDVTAVGANF